MLGYHSEVAVITYIHHGHGRTEAELYCVAFIVPINYGVECPPQSSTLKAQNVAQAYILLHSFPQA